MVFGGREVFFLPTERLPLQAFRDDDGGGGGDDDDDDDGMMAIKGALWSGVTFRSCPQA